MTGTGFSFENLAYGPACIFVAAIWCAGQSEFVHHPVSFGTFGRSALVEDEGLLEANTL